ncbi:MAG: hypothetical protein WA610_08745 [Thermodesulfovibrionales bacterium]
MKRAAAFILFIALAFSGSAIALGNPDFSGTWALDLDKSDTGQGRPSAMAAKAQKVILFIKQTPTALATTRKMGERSETSTEKLDGSESVNKSPSGQDIKSTNRWEGSTLVTKSIMPAGQGNVESSFVRSLSADGKVMTIDMTMKTPSGVSKKKLIYNKQ